MTKSQTTGASRSNSAIKPGSKRKGLAYIRRMKSKGFQIHESDLKYYGIHDFDEGFFFVVKWAKKSRRSDDYCEFFV